MPYDYDVIQLAIINPATVHLQLHRRFVNDFSTACYMITRHHAEKLVRLHCRGDKFKLDQGVKPRAVADDLIYNSGNTFAIPLFLYKIELGSDIHDIHVDVFHRSSHDGYGSSGRINRQIFKIGMQFSTMIRISTEFHLGLKENKYSLLHLAY